VFAGGDIVTGAATVIEAMGAGRRAAKSMKAFLGLREPDAFYAAGGKVVKHFGIDEKEKNFVRIRIAPTPDKELAAVSSAEHAMPTSTAEKNS
jgi:glutamate synthase (NADPH/NADH) small chain